MSVSAWLVSGCASRYVLIFSDTVLEVLAALLNVHVSDGVGATGSALADGMIIAADATPPSRPPANMPYRPRRTVVADIRFIGKQLLSVCDCWSHTKAYPIAHIAKRRRPRNGWPDATSSLVNE